MNRYRVAGGPAGFGIGQVLQLNAAQYDSRSHLVELVKKRDRTPKNEAEFVVKTRELMTFKVGEVVGLPDLPRNLVAILEPLDAPASETDRLAAEVASGRGDPGAPARS